MADHKKLLDFITNVSKDPVRLKAIAKNPDRELVAAGLAADEIEALKSMDSDRIRTLLVSKGASAASPTIVITAVIKF